MKHAATVPAAVLPHKAVSVDLRVALQVDSNTVLRVAMVLHRRSSMVGSRVAISSKVDKVATVALHHRNHSMAISSSMEDSSNSMEVEGMVRLRHSLLATR